MTAGVLVMLISQAGVLSGSIIGIHFLNSKPFRVCPTLELNEETVIFRKLQNKPDFEMMERRKKESEEQPVVHQMGTQCEQQINSRLTLHFEI